jgi:hypothetical protein
MGLTTMLHDLLAWCLHSPRRLTLTATALVIVAALAWTITPRGTGPSREADVVTDQTPVAAGAAKVPTAAPAAVKGEQVPVPDETPAPWPHVRSAVRSFLDTYLADPGRAATAIDPRLQHWVTPSLWRGLSLTDPGELPAGPVGSIDEVGTGAFAGETTVTLADDRTLTLTLVAWENHWRVADVRLGAPR